MDLSVFATWNTLQHCEALPLITTTYIHMPQPYSTMFPLPFGRVRKCKPKTHYIEKITILISVVPVHHHVPRTSSEVGRTKRTKRKCKAIIRSKQKNHELPQKWLVCKRGKLTSYCGIPNEFSVFFHIVHVFVKFYPTP